MKNEEQVSLAESLYASLKQNGYEVLLDDRNERPGVKFNDSDLIGLPVRVTVGKKASENTAEVKNRKTGESVEAHTDELMQVIADMLA